ncbi:uncharacterized protein [Medicago truncatula]|uniref:uncharacterized protein isoform X2 n=1 Tax=Medicago truncatula TaxID=3880 RepID=UPI00196763D0|nr:uncharacterized protein LOC120580587 isoform X2 [Medicago truncatula]XP_039690514.1 uncharacterized protein LOC120580595 isoform X2 [Medicago truncatula]
MKRKAFSLSPFSSAVQISECVPSSCSKNLKKPKILDEVNSMAAKASDSNWPPLLDEKMLEVFIAAHLRAMRSGPHLNSHSLEFWNKAETEVNRIITENFPQLLPKDVESLRKRLKYLRCNPKVTRNTIIVLVVASLQEEDLVDLQEEEDLFVDIARAQIHLPRCPRSMNWMISMMSGLACNVQACNV